MAACVVNDLLCSVLECFISYSYAVLHFGDFASLQKHGLPLSLVCECRHKQQGLMTELVCDLDGLLRSHDAGLFDSAVPTNQQTVVLLCLPDQSSWAARESNSISCRCHEVR